MLIPSPTEGEAASATTPAKSRGAAKNARTASLSGIHTVPAIAGIPNLPVTTEALVLGVGNRFFWEEKMIRIRNFAVRFVPVGEQFASGEINRLCPMVEFYDRRFNRRRYEGRGQFIVRLAAGIPFMPAAWHGLQLDDRVPEWSLGNEDVLRVREYISQHGGHHGVM